MMRKGVTAVQIPMDQALVWAEAGVRREKTFFKITASEVGTEVREAQVQTGKRYRAGTGKAGEVPGRSRHGSPGSQLVAALFPPLQKRTQRKDRTAEADLTVRSSKNIRMCG